MAETLQGRGFSRGPELRSVANSIEVLFPSSADFLRGVAREMDEAADGRESERALIDAEKRAAMEEALRVAGVKIADMRHGVSGRRVANAEWLGEVVYSMADELVYQAERADLESRRAALATEES